MTVKIDKQKCLTCAGCVGVCPANALDCVAQRIVCDENKCTSCGACERFCPVGAIKVEK